MASGITTQHHECDQPPNCALAVSVGAKQFSHVADGRGFRFDAAAPRGQEGAFGFQGRESAGRLVSLTGKALDAPVLAGARRCEHTLKKKLVSITTETSMWRA